MVGYVKGNKVLLLGGLFALIFFSAGAFALPTSSDSDTSRQIDSLEQAVIAQPVPSFMVAQAIPSLQVADYPDQLPSPPVLDPAVRTSSVADHSRGPGSTLTIIEMKLVMSGGRNFDPYTKKWGYRDAMQGERRNKFMLSWEAHRKRSKVNQLLPVDQLFSK